MNLLTPYDFWIGMGWDCRTITSKKTVTVFQFILTEGAQDNIACLTVIGPNWD